MIANILMLIIGLAVGGAAVWLIFKGKIQAAADKARAEGDAEGAGLKATLQARDLQIQGLSSSLEKLIEENARLQAELTAESTKRAAAEEKNSRIPKLESDLVEKDRQLSGLNTEITNLLDGLLALALV